MLNVFPQFLTYSFFAPFVLRVVLGLVFLDLGALKFKSEKNRWIKIFDTFYLRPATLFLPLYALVQIVGGLMLIVGVYTQLASLIFAISTAVEFSIEYKEGAILKRDIVFYLLVLAISLSLLVTGAGAFAFDIPL